jgi:LacI family transcriptional regulator
MANQKEIARLANVSQSVVSRVLAGRNSQRPVSEATISRVKQIAQALNYQPNQAARILVGAQTKLIGVIVRSFEDQYLTKILEELNTRALEAGYTLIVVGFRKGEFDSMETQLLCSYRPAAFVVIGSTDFRNWDPAFFQADKPVIQIGVPASDPRVISCGIDEPDAARLIVQHLAGLGHRTVGVIGDSNAASHLRLALLKAELAAHGLTCSLPCCFMSSHQDAAAGTDAAGYFLDKSVRPNWPTAIVALEDLIALAFIRRLGDAGIGVPADLSVASYDDIETAVLVRPSLTTIHQPVRNLAGAGMDMVTGRAPRASVMLPPVLQVRESTAPPRA